MEHEDAYLPRTSWHLASWKSERTDDLCFPSITTTGHPSSKTSSAVFNPADCHLVVPPAVPTLVLARGPVAGIRKPNMCPTRAREVIHSRKSEVPIRHSSGVHVIKVGLSTALRPPVPIHHRSYAIWCHKTNTAEAHLAQQTMEFQGLAKRAETAQLNNREFVWYQKIKMKQISQHHFRLIIDIWDFLLYRNRNSNHFRDNM